LKYLILHSWWGGEDERFPSFKFTVYLFWHYIIVRAILVLEYYDVNTSQYHAHSSGYSFRMTDPLGTRVVGMIPQK
jgi:hypothetical protein